MSSAPEAVVERLAVPRPRRRYPPFRRNRLSDEMLMTSKRFSELARLGRPGQWILHHEDLYEPSLDTRPQSRNPDEEVPVYSLDHHGAPTKEIEFVWAGKGPTPDFQDVAFWKDKQKHLDDKIEQVKARLVRPRFTPEELQTLEALERQPRHFFKTQLYVQRKKMCDNKNGVFVVLFRLALLGRPGQWILHNEELYHPVIDTRPQTRAAEKSIVIRDAHYKGDTRVAGDGILVDFELTWAGQVPPPDFDDFFFWEDKLADLYAKERQVKEGRVQPQFTPDELRTLEALETDQEHAFAKFRKERMEKPPAVAKTEEEVAASRKLALARCLVVNMMDSLWYLGLAGQWVLHWERLFLPQFDTHFRERYNDGDEDIFPDSILVDSDYGLRFDTRFGPPPDFDDIAYWERKRAELRKKKDEVQAGRLTEHRFTKGELIRIELLERAISEQLEDSGTDPKTRGIEAWIDANATKVVVGDEHSRPRGPEVAKRKRSTDSDSDDESLPGHAMRPVKRSKKQPPPEPSATVPMQRDVSRTPSPPRQKAPSASRLDPANAGTRADGRSLAARRGTRRSVNVSNGAADRQTQPAARARRGAGRHRRRRGGSPAETPPGSLRRSARIAALPPRRTLYR